MSDLDVAAVAQKLRNYATHFAPRDWDYTRDISPLRAIRYDYDYDRLWARLRRALRYLVLPNSGFGKTMRVSRWSMIWHTCLRRDDHKPDGVLDNGSIITFWEETGEYLQFVQPSVGALIADWLTAEPDNPHAVLVAAEMQRIQDDYAARIKADQR